MTLKWIRKPVVSLLLGILLAPLALIVPALASGFPVFDAANFEQAIQQLLQMEQQYRQLVQTYQTLRSQYEHMQRMARTVPVNMVLRYKALATPWRLTSASNVSGKAGPWIESINTGLNIAEGYAKATEEMGRYDAAMADLPAEQAERAKTSYSTVELADGANLHSIETIGRLRAHAADVERAIDSLEDDSLSANPEMNTEIGVLNKINAASMIGIRTQQDTNKLLVALAESQLVDGKRKRDSEAQANNNHIRFRK
jgi:hypothetical protein